MADVQERWLPVVRWEGIYEVSDIGRVQRILQTRGTRCGVLSTPPDDNGYPQVNLRRAGRYEHCKVHALVAEAFIGPRPPDAEVCHGDGDPGNCAAANLRYDTHSGNELDKGRHGTHHNSRKTHCPQRHEYTAQNTYINPRGARECRTCKHGDGRRAA